MRILIVGNGGREHALAWKLLKDAPEATLFVTQPNGGMIADVESVAIAPGDVVALAGWADAQSIDLVVVGPEGPLASGLVDRLERSGIPAFGPTKAAARIESSKSYAKALMQRAGVPTADFASFVDHEEAQAYVREQGAPIVVKASGLAAGKGAIVCETVDEALGALDNILANRTLGEAGREVVVEEFMGGEELSVFAFADGQDAVLMLPSQDHKRVGEGDVGPNTGGMGAYAPVSLSSPSLLSQIQDRIIAPTLAALAEDGSEFRGILYAGIMLTEDGPRVVEFNCRFGDPEIQVVLPLLESSLLEPVLEVARGGRLGNTTFEWSSGAALTTVLASEGYPGSYAKGRPIHIPESVTRDPNVLLFHAGTTVGTTAEAEELETSGGRVIAVTGLGTTLEEAGSKSREAADAIEFSGKQFRKDIGWREFARAEPRAEPR
jgi:phosphoribosylamine--glycine ligase